MAAPTNRRIARSVPATPKSHFQRAAPENQKQKQYKDRDHRYRNSTVQPISVLEACMV
jgi:hypothetical protein